MDSWREVSETTEGRPRLCQKHEECPIQDAPRRKGKHSVIAEFLLLMRSQKSGVAKPSLMSELLDDYDPALTNDAEHEYDLKLVGGIILGGKIEISAF